MTIHPGDPFATPEDARSPLRRLRGRIPAAVTLWTAYGNDKPAGLTVSSTVIADGEPAAVLGLVDDESDLYTALLASKRCTVMLLADGDNQLADRFAGLMPAPGGLFADGVWDRTPFGPVRPGRHPWVGCTLLSTRRVGYAMLIEAAVERIELGDEVQPAPLLRHRGRYVSLSRK